MNSSNFILRYSPAESVPELVVDVFEDGAAAGWRSMEMEMGGGRSGTEGGASDAGL